MINLRFPDRRHNAPWLLMLWAFIHLLPIGYGLLWLPPLVKEVFDAVGE